MTKFFKANNTEIIKTSNNHYCAIWRDNNNDGITTPFFETLSELMDYIGEINNNNNRDAYENVLFETIIDDLFTKPYISKGKRVDNAYMLFIGYEVDPDPSINAHALRFNNLAEFEAAHCDELFN